MKTFQYNNNNFMKHSTVPSYLTVEMHTELIVLPFQAKKCAFSHKLLTQVLTIFLYYYLTITYPVLLGKENWNNLH